MGREVTMKRAIAVLAASLTLISAAPQFLTETISSNCRSEVTTVFEETEPNFVEKVICQTEFRDECVVKVDTVCRNVSTGVEECHNVENFVCVDSTTNKCGLEKVFKKVPYSENVCKMKPQDICEHEVVDGESRPVPGSCVTKSVEVCELETGFRDEIVEEEMCRDIPIKDCKNVQEEVCNEKQDEECETFETENCDIVPHEECEKVVEEVPNKISKKVTKIVCDEDNEKTNEDIEMAEDNNNDVLNGIFEIFGISNTNENEVAETVTESLIDDGFFQKKPQNLQLTRRVALLQLLPLLPLQLQPLLK